MKFKSNITVILSLVMIIFPLGVYNNLNFNNEQKSIVINPKNSGSYTESFIHIDASNPKNWSWTAGNYSWCYFENGIYFIENVTIDASNSPTGNGIYIENSKNEYFTIRNCTVFNADNGFPNAGIRLENTNNGTVINNNCYDNNYGIYLYECEANNITENSINNNGDYGIDLNTNCLYNNISHNIINQNEIGIYFDKYCSENVIYNNNLSKNTVYGIKFRSNTLADKCENNTITNNTIIENGLNGIYFEKYCIKNTIFNNTISNNKQDGIYLYYLSDDNNITGNILNNNENYGLYLYRCENNNITGNTINNNLEIGIFLDFLSHNNKIKNNSVNRNDLGIGLKKCDNNNITGNTLQDNNWCIYETDCEGTIIEFNDCSSNKVETPIYIDDDLTGVGAHNWTWAESQTWCSGKGSFYKPYIIEKLIISGFGLHNGIEIHNSDVNFIIRDCEIINSESTIYLNNVNNSQLIENNCSNVDWGIFLEDSNNLTIVENTINYTTYEGIYLFNCDYNNITGNLVNDNYHGIYIEEFCDNNLIIENTINRNVEYGIYLDEDCYNNTISGNTVENNYDGISLNDNCIDNTILGNFVNFNRRYGIYLSQVCDSNNITGNTINNNMNSGIRLSSYCNKNNISGNTVNDNGQFGIFLVGVCDENNITHNNINRNLCGILLYSSNKNNISKNVLNDNQGCIFEIYCISNIIENNDCSGSILQEPIKIDDSATGIGAHNWTWALSQPWCSGSGTWKDPYIIKDVTIDGLGLSDCIEIQNSNAFFIIQNCTCYNSPDDGINLDTVNNSRLINNNCSDIGYTGINLEHKCSNNTVSGNIVYDINYAGIYLYEYCNNNTVSGNTVKYNEIGISLHWHTNDTIITENIVNNNQEYGIELYDWCGYNKITNNIINDNGERGIDIEYENNYNLISNNILNNNTEYGIYLYTNCDYTTICNNFITNNYAGIRFESYCDYNIITDNRINDNIQYGVWLSGQESDTCNYNEIRDNILKENTQGVYLDSYTNNSTLYKNVFLVNIIHAIDDGTDNMWNNTLIGNYWDNHTSPDINSDGIVDNPYIYIGGSTGSIDYLPIAEDGVPLIMINSPNSGDGFSTTAPFFDVTVTDTLLDTMWYTINGGVINYTFTENDMINQTAWDAMSDGSVILMFYASDIIRNIGSAGVNIIKDTLAPVITIHSPIEGETYGRIPPLFNVSIIESNLELFWYSFDGGLTTYVITNNNVFNQTAWTELSKGNVIITFYARDIAGNEATEDVTIIKSVPSGLDPGVIITIVIVSIVGGVAVICVVYIFMKKRAT